jgi:hypothetical protein
MLLKSKQCTIQIMMISIFFYKNKSKKSYRNGSRFGSFAILGIIVSLVVLLSACASSKKTAETPATAKRCNTIGKVRDYTNVDDCGYLIELESGAIIFPQSMKADDPNYRLGPDHVIRLDYNIIPNSSSLCNVKGKPADITCLQELKPYAADCVDMDTPNVEWMSQLIDILRPNKMYKYLRDNEIWYVFDCEKEMVLYDCKGYCICQHFKSDMKNQCKEIPKHFGKIIYMAELNHE